MSAKPAPSSRPLRAAGETAVDKRKKFLYPWSCSGPRRGVCSVRTWTRGGGRRRPGSPPGSRRRTKDKVRPAKREGAESAPGSSFHPPTSRAERRGLAASRLPLYPTPLAVGPPATPLRAALHPTSGPKGRGAERASLLPGTGRRWPSEARSDEGPKSSQAPPPLTPTLSPFRGEGAGCGLPNGSAPPPRHPRRAAGAGRGSRRAGRRAPLARPLWIPFPALRAAGDDGAALLRGTGRRWPSKARSG